MNFCLFESFINLMYSYIEQYKLDTDNTTLAACHQGLDTHKWCYSPSEDQRGVFIVSLN